MVAVLKTFVAFLDMGDEILNYFSKPVVLHHPGGHFIPNGPEQRKVYADFLAQQLETIGDSSS